MRKDAAIPPLLFVITWSIYADYYQLSNGCKIKLDWKADEIGGVRRPVCFVGFGIEWHFKTSINFKFSLLIQYFAMYCRRHWRRFRKFDVLQRRFTPLNFKGVLLVCETVCLSICLWFLYYDNYPDLHLNRFKMRFFVLFFNNLLFNSEKKNY